MTNRERLYPEVKRLREDEGLEWKAIGERIGLSLKTVWDYYNDPTGDKHQQRMARYRLKDFGPCPSCGEKTTGSTLRSGGVCLACLRHRNELAIETRLQDIAQMYRDGMPVKEIAKELGYGPNSRPPQITELHRRGLVTHRYKAYEERAA